MDIGNIKEYLKIIDQTIENGQFKDDWNSLSKHKTPEWYAYGKLGLFIHWGVYSVPAYYDEWYPRLMYIKNSPVNKHHKKVYGGVEKFPYKNFIPMFKAENFNADEWLDLFKKSGAKFIMPVGEHHDGFKMYKSNLNKWNSADMGPKVNILEELHKSCDKYGITFCTSSHRAEHFWFFNGCHDFDCDITQGKDKDLYGPAHRKDSDTTIKLLTNCHEFYKPTQQWLEDWLVSSAEMIDLNRPSAVYFDWWITQKDFRPYIKKFLAYYYNRALEWGKEVTVFYKMDSVVKNCATFDVERGQLNGISPEIWQNDTAIAKNSWGYTEGNKFKTANEIACNFADVISKNGCFMLNVGPKADGTICDEEKKVLLELGEWINTCKEAIYGCRPFDIYGENKKERKSGSFKENFKYTSKDIRFTYNNGCIYMFALGTSKNNKYISKYLGRSNQNIGYCIKKIFLLGSDAQIKYQIDKKGLHLSINGNYKKDMPLCFKIELD